MKLKQWQQYFPRLIDTHCHLTHYSNANDTLEKVQEFKIGVHCMSVTPEEFCQIKKISHANIRVALGYFPLEVQKNYPASHELFWQLLPQEKLIGEVGLDYSNSSPNEIAIQKEFFQNLINKCQELEGRVLSIHSRRAIEDVLQMLNGKDKVTAILHWFSGSETALDQAIANPQVYFSINSAMTSARRLRPFIKKIPLEKILLETDGPYIQINKSPAEPSDIRLTLEAIARIKELPLSAIIDAICENQKCAFGY